MVVVIRGYLGAWRYSAFNEYLAEWLRNRVDVLRDYGRLVVEQEGREDNQERDALDLLPEQDDVQRLRDDMELLQLREAGSDGDFFRAFGTRDSILMSNQYQHMLQNGAHYGSIFKDIKLPTMTGYLKAVASVTSFVSLLTKPGDAKFDDNWPDALLVLQKKIFEKAPDPFVSRLLSSLDGENRKLKEENRRKEKELEECRAIVSDLSFRHLLEMLAKASHDAKQGPKTRGPNPTEPTPPKEGSSQRKTKKGKKIAPSDEPAPEVLGDSQKMSDKKDKDPQWQDFWKEAWGKASGGTKEGPLRDLWIQSEGRNDIRRGQIKSEGDRIFGFLSVNIHDCEALFDTRHCNDSIRRGLLDALKPLEENRKKNGRIDWNEEVKRFI